MANDNIPILTDMSVVVLGADASAYRSFVEIFGKMADVQGEFVKMLRGYQKQIKECEAEILTLRVTVTNYIADGGQASEIANNLTSVCNRLEDASASLTAAINLSND